MNGSGGSTSIPLFPSRYRASGWKLGLARSGGHAVGPSLSMAAGRDGKFNAPRPHGVG
jgi:hypothetical protein